MLSAGQLLASQWGSEKGGPCPLRHQVCLAAAQAGHMPLDTFNVMATPSHHLGK